MTPNNYMQRSVTDKVLGRGRVFATHSQVTLARVRPALRAAVCAATVRLMARSARQIREAIQLLSFSEQEEPLRDLLEQLDGPADQVFAELRTLLKKYSRISIRQHDKSLRQQRKLAMPATGDFRCEDFRSA